MPELPELPDNDDEAMEVLQRWYNAAGRQAFIELSRQFLFNRGEALEAIKCLKRATL